jgi:glucose/arabinose dehydrogenase
VRRLPVVLALVIWSCGGGGSAEPTLASAPIGPGTTTPSPIALPAAVEPGQPLQGLEATLVADGLERPSFAIAPWGDPRLFVLDQPGRVWIVSDGTMDPDPFLDISDRVGSTGLEQGLLGMAFHPGYPDDPRVFLSFTDRDGDSRLVSYRVSPDPDRADPASGVDILAVPQPASNHNGGMILFGPDGYLYLGLGDGGGANDQFGHGQRSDTLLGSILRVDVDAASPYAVPPDNPFAGEAGAAEVWAFGLRNPWRFDIDPVTGVMYVADVGQSTWEEVSVVPSGAVAANLGWSILEGDDCFVAAGCDTAGTLAPAVVYGRDQGCSVTGGFVYRGAAIPELAGHYLYSDWCGGWLRSFDVVDGAAVDAADWSDGIGDLGRISSFGRDGFGELYLVATDGRLWRIDPVS